MKRYILIASAAAAMTIAGAANATVLTFDIDVTRPTENLPMDQSYGDRVTSTTVGNASYGVGSEGYTPNVVASYGPGDASLTRWSGGYGDLTNVFENEDDGDDLVSLTLTADAGYSVSLFDFDLVGYYGDYTVPGLTIVGDGKTLFSASDFLVQGALDGTAHSTLDFSGAPLTASSISILVDLTGLGGNSDNIGFDNVRFGQSGLVPSTPAVPEPASWAMMIAGFGLVGGMARRKRAALALTA